MGRCKGEPKSKTLWHNKTDRLLRLLCLLRSPLIPDLAGQGGPLVPPIQQHQVHLRGTRGGGMSGGERHGRWHVAALSQGMQHS